MDLKFINWKIKYGNPFLEILDFCVDIISKDRYSVNSKMEILEESLSYNPNLTLDWIRKYPFIHFDWNLLTECNPEISERLNITYKYNINYDLIRNTSNLQRCYLLDREIPLDILESQIQKGIIIGLDIIQNNKNITLDFVDKYNLYNFFSGNCNCTIDFVLQNKDKNWNWGILSSFMNIKDILNHPELTWDYNCIKKRHDLGLDNKLKLGDVDWYNLSYCSDLTIDFVLQNKDKDWDWLYITSKFATEQLIKDNIDLPWNYNRLYSNLNISLGFILKYSDIKLSKLYPYRNIEDIRDILFLGDYEDIVYISRNNYLYNENLCNIEKIKDLKYRQDQLQKLFVSYSPFCEDLDYFFRKYLNYN